MPDADLAALHKTLSGSSLGLESKPGDYVELVDESDPDGLVRFCRANGQVTMVMSRATYEAFDRRTRG